MKECKGVLHSTIRLTAAAGLLAGTLILTGCATGGGSGEGDEEFAWEYLFDDNASASAAAGGEPRGGKAREDGLLTVGEVDSGAGDIMTAERLEPDDALTISLLGLRNEQVIEERVDEKGMISMPYLDPIRAAGLTSSELEEVIRDTYLDEKIFKQVTVKVIIPCKNIFFITGKVNAPGRYQLTPGMSVMQAIAAASGFNNFANKRTVWLTRKGKTYKIDLNEIRDNPSIDVLLRAEDQLLVKEGIL